MAKLSVSRDPMVVEDGGAGARGRRCRDGLMARLAHELLMSRLNLSPAASFAKLPLHRSYGVFATRDKNVMDIF